MTEQEWLEATEDPGKMLGALRHRASDLKLRLLAVAHARRRWDTLHDQRSRNAVEVASRYAEGRATEDELAAAHEAARSAGRESLVLQGFHWVHRDGARPDMAQSASAPDGELGHAVRGWMPRGDFPEPRELCWLIREVFGNPFREVVIDPHWPASNDGAVRRLAQAIHEESAFDRLPLLADALEETGCRDGELLRHCREPGEHVRGCWALDRLRGLDGVPSGPLSTEAEWIAPGQNLWRMLSSLDGKVSNRKTRLFAAACCRRIFHLIEGERSRAAVEVVERHADGRAGDDELLAAARGALAQFREQCRHSNYYPVARADACAHACAAGVDAVSRGLLMNRPAILFDPDPGFRCIGLEAARLVLEGTAHSRAGTRPTPRELLLDVFGNPFRPVAVDPAWRTPDVITLAEGIYADRASDRMPILADALQDAGCDNEDVLSHCRGGGPHVRGCWVVDLVLGKE